MFTLEMTVSARGHAVQLKRPLNDELALSDAIAEAAASMADEMGVPLARIELGIALADRMDEFARMACPSVSANRAGFVTAVPPGGAEDGDKSITIRCKGDGAGRWYDFAAGRGGDAYALAEWAFGDQAPHVVAQFLEVREQAAAPAPGGTGVLDLDSRRGRRAKGQQPEPAACPECGAPPEAADDCDSSSCPMKDKTAAAAGGKAGA